MQPKVKVRFLPFTPASTPHRPCPHLTSLHRLCPRRLLQIPLFFATVLSYHVLMKAAPAQFVGMTVVGMISFTLINYGSTFLSPSSSSILTAFAICVVRPRQLKTQNIYPLSHDIHNATSASHRS